MLKLRDSSQPLRLQSTGRRRFSALLLSSALLPAHHAVAQPSTAPASTYAPTRGQEGKDVVWEPTPDAMVDRMLLLAGLKPSDTLIDLGSGDGKIVMAAARAGARGIGVEFNAELVALARQRATASGLAERAHFEQGDIFTYDFSRASVVTLYLLPRINLRLRHQLLALTPGTRVVSHSFDMGDWKADETTYAGGATAYLWIVPANAGGEWQLRFPLEGGEARALLQIEQRFQHINGVAIFRDFTASLREALLEGDRVRFALTDADGHVRRFDGRLAGGEITGVVDQGARSVPFSARRVSGVVPSVGGSEAVVLPAS